MSIYQTIYDNLCESRKSKHTDYRKGSGLHEHHIIPTHNGGQDSQDNYTYLTAREHVIAHFLLWKINGMVNDLRSMHMLGAKLTYEQRRIVGRWCYENKIGVHGMGNDFMMKNLNRGRETQKLQCEEYGTKNWHYWSTEAGRTERSSIGGKLGGKSTKENNKGWWDPKNAELMKQACIAGGKSTIGSKWLYNKETLDSKMVKPDTNQYRELIQAGYTPGQPPRSEKRVTYHNKLLQVTKLIKEADIPNLSSDWVLGRLPGSNMGGKPRKI
jgi:hypothetical protein